MTKQLSPAAEAVLNAVTEAQYGSCYMQFERISSAVLRAAAEIVAPLSCEDVWTDGRMLQYKKDDPVRNKLLAIADELEDQ